MTQFSIICFFFANILPFYCLSINYYNILVYTGGSHQTIQNLLPKTVFSSKFIQNWLFSWAIIAPNNFIIVSMKKPFSQTKISESIVLQQEGVYTLKISNFDPKIWSSSFGNNSRYQYQQKITKRREMVQTATSRYDRSQYNPQYERRVRSTHQVRMQTDQKLNKLKVLQQLNQQIQILTPVLDEKIVELKNSMFRKASSTRKCENKQQNVHFTEYILKGAFLSSTTVLHSRKKKECPFMKSVKARSLMNKSNVGKPKKMIQDLFKSIELNNSSKYASSKQISVSGGSITKNTKVSKNRGNFGRQFSKNYVDRRQALIARRQKVYSPQKKDECRPWETHHALDVANDDDLIHL